MSLQVELPAFVREQPRIEMERDAGGFRRFIETDEQDQCYGTKGGVELAFVEDDGSFRRWSEAIRRIGKDVPEARATARFRCRLGPARSIVRGGWERGHGLPGFLVTGWCRYYVYVPHGIGTHSLEVTFTGSWELFREERRKAMDAMVKTARRNLTASDR